MAEHGITYYATLAEHAIACVRRANGNPVANPYPAGTQQHKAWQAAHDRALASDQLEGSAA